MSKTKKPSGQIKTVFPENASVTTPVPLNQIDDNPYQPRQTLAEAETVKLARSLRLKRATLTATSGLMQVPMGRAVAGRIQLAFGHRRLAAFRYNYQHHQQSGDWSFMPVQIVELSNEEMYQYAASENADRVELNAIEKAKSIQDGMAEFGWSYRQAGQMHQISKSTAANLVRLLQLPEEVQVMVTDGLEGNEGRHYLGQRHARELVRLMQHEPPLARECKRIAHTACIDQQTVCAVANRIDTAIRQEKCETRYCLYCDHSQEVSGNKIEHDNNIICRQCRRRLPVSMWLREPSKADPEPPCDSPEHNQDTASEFYTEAGPEAEANRDDSFQHKLNFVTLLTKLNQQETNLIGQLVGAPQRAPRGNYAYIDVAEAAARAMNGGVR